MTGTVIITGATGSLAIEAVQQLLLSHPSLTIVGTVRNATKSPKSPHLVRLEEIGSQFPAGKLLIKSVDLNSISEARAFAGEIAGLVESKQLPPIIAMICNAFTWSLDGQMFSNDRLESTFQVNHLAHFLLVLKLLRSMDREAGRIVMLSSEVHDPERTSPLSKLGAKLPANDNLDVLIKPGPDEVGTEHDMGWRRYANSKLANVMFMQSLNQRLQKVRILPYQNYKSLLTPCLESAVQQNHGDCYGSRWSC
jgi:WW domain-containing oxidoreductase